MNWPTDFGEVMITVYRHADNVKPPFMGLNRVCGQLIGVYATLPFRHTLSFVWRRAAQPPGLLMNKKEDQ